MNKKLLKGALALFASIFMAVSCSAGDKTGGGDDKPSVSKSDVETFLKRLGGDASLTVDSGATLGEGNTFAVALDGSTAQKTVDDIKKVLSDTLTADNNIQAVTANDIADNRLEVKADTDAVTYTITLKAKDGYNIGSFGTVKVKVAASREKKWKKIVVAKAAIEKSIKEALGDTVDTFNIKTGTADISGASKTLTIKITDNTYNGTSKVNTVKPILENKFDNVKTVLVDLGIITSANAFKSIEGSSADLTATLENCKLNALYSIDGTIDSGMTSGVEKVEIKLNTSQNWS